MLQRSRIVGVFAGLAVVTVVGVGCLSSYVANIRAEKDKRELGRIVSSVESSISEDKVIEYVEKGDYSKIEFSTIEEFVNSLQSLIRVDGADKFYQSKLYDSGSKELVNLFETESGNVSVAVTEEGVLEYCKFKGIDEEDMGKILELSEDSEYSCKEINDGFVLERSIVA